MDLRKGLKSSLHTDSYHFLVQLCFIHYNGVTVYFKSIAIHFGTAKIR